MNKQYARACTVWKNAQQAYDVASRALTEAINDADYHSEDEDVRQAYHARVANASAAHLDASAAVMRARVAMNEAHDLPLYEVRCRTGSSFRSYFYDDIFDSLEAVREALEELRVLTNAGKLGAEARVTIVTPRGKKIHYGIGTIDFERL